MGESSQRASASVANVLLVDDDAEVLRVLGRALSTPDVVVTSVQSGMAALAELEGQAFDAVVSDIQMPAMNGVRLLRAVREYDLDLPVVLMTGQPDLKNAAAAVEFGVFQYLIKPISIDRLRAVVDRAINSGRIARLKRQCALDFGSGSFYVGDLAGIETKLNRALATLSMAYQPVVRAADGETFGYEALLRCDEPALPRPSSVLKAAARLRRLHDVGRAVRDQVAADVEPTLRKESFFFVNMHPEDLMDPTLYLPNAPLSRIAKSIVLELTDRASLENVTNVAERVEQLRALGYRVSLDDVGAGRAGLETFAQLEPEFVKLDPALIRTAHCDASKLSMVRSLTRVCHDMGKSVIAEGVESSEERDVLIDAGCDFMQGYFFGRPGPLLGHTLGRRTASPSGAARTG